MHVVSNLNVTHSILDFTKSLEENNFKILNFSTSIEFCFGRAIVNCHNVVKSESSTITTLSSLYIEYVWVICESYPLLQYIF